ncbi:variant erythrocyte surface antigen-1, alpha subunit [Babesia caballi]|uniref:Variant erythrocyte surface antigen-1, alpha subunit n=1 Tax=Babesia caballi TaxID=5871 RepID=A0AAV4M269_BABCB|nr:variant erythrocyte surface antigen-1, alpha subunit [Babesia caballi]
MATHRLCDAAIAFTIAVLESLSKEKGIQEKDKKEINTVISELHGAFGKSVNDGLKGVAQNMNTKLNNFTGSDTVIEAVKKVGTTFKSKLSSASGTAQALADEVGGYIDEVVKQVSLAGGGNGNTTQISLYLTRLGQELTNNAFNPTEQKIKSKIFSVDVALRYALQPDTLKIISTVKDALTAGANAFTNHLKAKYESAYLNVTKDTNDLKYAKISLGCLPLVFGALSHLYWRCDLTHGNGKWNAMTLCGDKHGKDDLKDFMYSMAYGSSILSVGKTGNVVSRALEKFEDFTVLLSTSRKSYPKFIKELRRTGREKLGEIPCQNEHPLSTLYSMAQLYFTGKQIQSNERAKTPPSTIRHMLYFLAALPFSPEFGGCENHINKLLSSPLAITIAGSSAYSTLTADNITSNLTTTTSLFSTRILGLLQGLGDSKEKSGEPWLHHLYCNGLKLKYPSGSALFNAVHDYIYAVQFQLHFLYRQCSVTYTQGCGWRDCRWGKNITGNSIKSHLCPTIYQLQR